MNYALILSGGTGARLKATIPKQYISVNGKLMIMYCLETILKSTLIEGVQIVAEEMWQDLIKDALADIVHQEKFRGFSLPGKNRQLSILNGLQDMCQYASEEDRVFIHDAARPMLSSELISECFEAAKGHDGVLPVLPVKDTVYLSRDGKGISDLLKREEVFAGQAPEVFNFKKYLKANERLLPDKILKINGSTEPAVMAGMDIVLIPGDERNFKITTEADMERFQEITRR